MTEREKMTRGLLFNVHDPELVRFRMDARKILEKYNKTLSTPFEKRTKLLKRLLGSTGIGFAIEPNFKCDYGFNIHVGDNFYANYDCVFLDVCEIRIGRNGMIGPQVGLYTSTHPVDPVRRINRECFGKPITIGNNCWIGGHATIIPGVTLGNNVVVASGSVVTKSFGDNVVIGGNPARILKGVEREDW